jgi:hypothetical protein
MEFNISYEERNIDLGYFERESEDNVWLFGTGNNK